jgi:hypothetical protein
VTREIFQRAGVAEGRALVDGTWRSNIFCYPPIGLADAGAYASANDLLIFLDAVGAGSC